VTCWDVRKFETRNFHWSFVAHTFGGCKGLSCNPRIPGMMATCSADKTVALWDTGHIATGKHPYLCCSKDMKVGKLYTVSFYPSSPWLLACGGSENELALWDISMETLLRDRFSDVFVSLE
jgi:WD40 repeat protein